MRYFLPKEGKPSPLEEGVVEEIERRVAEWNGGGWLKAFKSQQPVVIAAGILKGVQALFQRYLPPQRALSGAPLPFRSKVGGRNRYHRHPACLMGAKFEGFPQ